MALRLHDTEGLDWFQIFPDASANPDLPSSYDFAAADRIIGDLVNQSIMPVVRLGTSWGAPKRYRIIAPGPKSLMDPLKFAEISKRIVMHYNAGWNNGFAYRIKYWEIWNEPDLRDRNGIGEFWTGTMDQFTTLYATVARSLKSYDPSLKVGGPAQAMPQWWTLPQVGFGEGFIAYNHAHAVPMDFFSWHRYGNDGPPSSYALVANLVQKWLNAHSFRQAESLVTEMSAGSGVSSDSPDGSVKAGAFDVAAITYLIYAGVNGAFHYPLSFSGRGPFSSATGGATSESNAYRAVGAFRSATPLVLATSGTDYTSTSNFTVLAGRDKSGKTVQILTSDYSKGVSQISIRIKDFEPNTVYTGGYHVIDASRNWQQVPLPAVVTDSRGSADIEVDGLDAPSVVLIKISK